MPADILGISVRSLQYRLKEYQKESEDEKNADRSLDEKVTNFS